MWVNSPFQNCGLLPPISQVCNVLYFVTSSKAREVVGVRLEQRSRECDLRNDEACVDRGLHVGRLGGVDLVLRGCLRAAESFALS